MTRNDSHNVDLHIEELVLRGFKPQGTHQIAAALRQELQALLNQRGIPQRLTNGKDVSLIDGGTIRIGPRASRGNTGAKIARNLYKGIQK